MCMEKDDFDEAKNLQAVMIRRISSPEATRISSPRGEVVTVPFPNHYNSITYVQTCNGTRTLMFVLEGE